MWLRPTTPTPEGPRKLERLVRYPYATVYWDPKSREYRTNTYDHKSEPWYYYWDSRAYKWKRRREMFGRVQGVYIP